MGDSFGVSESLADKAFNHFLRLLVARLYDLYMRLPLTEEKWKSELQGFIENYEFPCVGACDDLYVYVFFKLKQFYTFKKRYTMTNLALGRNNKRISYVVIGALGSTDDARMLESKQLYQDILR